MGRNIAIRNNKNRAIMTRVKAYLKKKGVPTHNIKRGTLIRQYCDMRQIELVGEESLVGQMYDRLRSRIDPDFGLVDAGFYLSDEWLQLRPKVFKVCGYKCLKCGGSENIAIDHIKPRSLFPSMELDLSNMQVLCRSCNSKKGNREFSDYRTDDQKAALCSNIHQEACT